MSKYITATPGIMSGKPVIAGTRIPISRIIFLLKQGYPLEAIHDQYPHVALETLSKVIDEIIEIVTNSPDVSKISQVQATS
ncbi:MAG TPA: DUF433 domain-containing protein [Candidatus Saccharimonadales bacterium]|nr:DUF433 domain-containing protein [Candidatus Saccharimonadales bacterium]